MSQMLATDLNNPEFVGAINPDSQLHVEFYMHKPIDKWRSDEETVAQGRRVTIYRKKFTLDAKGNATYTNEDLEIPYVRIMNPGDKTSIVETPALNAHKQRFPQQWMAFQIAEGLADGGDSIPGWKLEEWKFLADKPDLLRDLKHSRFYTVELLAGASDGQVQKLGIGGLGFRQEARKALAEKQKSETQTAVESRDAQMAAMQKKIDELSALLEKKGR